MLKKFIKVWFKFVAVSCMAYVAANNTLEATKVAIAKKHGDTGENGAKLKYNLIIVDAFNMYKEAFQLWMAEYGDQ